MIERDRRADGFFRDAIDGLQIGQLLRARVATQRRLLGQAFDRLLPHLAHDARLVVGVRPADKIDAVSCFATRRNGVGLVKQEHRATQLHLVAVVQLLHANRGAVDERAVGAAAVFDDEHAVHELDDRVLPRSLVVADANFIAEPAPQADRLFADLKAGTLVSPADHEERRLRRPGSLVRCHVDSTW